MSERTAGRRIQFFSADEEEQRLSELNDKRQRLQDLADEASLPDGLGRPDELIRRETLEVQHEMQRLDQKVSRSVFPFTKASSPCCVTIVHESFSPTNPHCTCH